MRSTRAAEAVAELTSLDHMRRWQKWAFIALGISLLIFVAPMVFAYFRPRGLAGYYQIGSMTCACGHIPFTRITEDEYCVYLPAHNSTSFAYRLRKQGSEWVATQDPTPTNSFRLRVRDGEVYCSDFSGTNWYHKERVYNLWRVWIPRLFAD